MKKLGECFLTALKKIKLLFVNVIDCKKSIACFSLVLFGSISLLISGALNSDTRVYKSASYVAELVEKTKDVDHIAVVVEQKEKGFVPDTATELRGLYGAFGNRESNYAGTVNACKDSDITFADFNIEDRISFVYVQTGTQVSNKTDDDGTVHHRMEFYPLELMFEFYANSPTNFYSFLYLSTSQAREVINLRYPGLFDTTISIDELLKNDLFISKCKEIVGTGVNIKFGKEIKSFQITNIFYESDYFYNIVHNTIGEFLVGYNQYPDGFQKQATYFLNKYEYQNKFYLDYIKERYSKDNFIFDSTNVSLNGIIDQDKILNCLDGSSDFASISFLTLSIVSTLIAFIAMFRYRLLNLSFAFYCIVSLLTPYIFGFLLWKISNNLALFSPYFTTALLIYLLAISLFLICSLLVKKWKVTKKEIGC